MSKHPAPPSSEKKLCPAFCGEWLCCAVLPVTVLRIPGQLEANNAIISWGNGYIYNKWSTMKPSKHHQIQKQ